MVQPADAAASYLMVKTVTASLTLSHQPEDRPVQLRTGSSGSTGGGSTIDTAERCWLGFSHAELRVFALNVRIKGNAQVIYSCMRGYRQVVRGTNVLHLLTLNRV